MIVYSLVSLDERVAQDRPEGRRKGEGATVAVAVAVASLTLFLCVATSNETQHRAGTR